jgi:hypothetical protein
MQENDKNTNNEGFRDLMQKMGASIYEAMWEKRGVEINDKKVFIVTNKEEFVTGVKEAFYKQRPSFYGSDMKGYLDAGIFKILVRDNFCFVHADLDKAAHYIASAHFISGSRFELNLRSSLASYAIRLSESFLEKGYTIERIRSSHGRVANGFLGAPDVVSPTLFTAEMNDLYQLAFVFDNTPPLTFTEDEFIGR